jgi:lipoprotein-anchoring transpeptidase ErfK/SrfK
MKRVIAFVFIFVFLISQTGFAQKRVEINIPSRTLKLFDDNTFIKIYPVAVGRPSYDSPIGHYRILNKVVNPTWWPVGQKPVPPGPNNPLGTRWIGFYSDYGIHGNSNPNSIGTFASKGCIRMQNFDVEELFDKVQPGNAVDIYYNTFYTYDNPDKSKAALIIYRILYNKGLNKISRINQELNELGILKLIDSKKLDKLYKSVNKNSVIFAKGWTLFVNGEYISPDTKMRTVEANMNKMSIPIPSAELIGCISTEIPNTNSTLKILLPIMFQMAISDCFLRAATMEVTNSGNEVPTATTVIPISISLKPSI